MTRKTPLSKKAIKASFDKTEPVYIVGGGASLRDFDFTQLAGKQVIALNTAFRKAPNASAMFFCDINFYNQWKDPSPSGDFWRFKGEIFTTCEGFADHPRINSIKLSAKDLDLTQMNAGCNAIALAKEMGAKTVVLLGFDLVAGNWHDGTPLKHQRSTSPKVYNRYIKNMDDVCGVIKGLKIYNANDKNRLQYAQAINIENAFNLNMEN